MTNPTEYTTITEDEKGVLSKTWRPTRVAAVFTARRLKREYGMELPSLRVFIDGPDPDLPIEIRLDGDVSPAVRRIGWGTPEENSDGV